MQDISQLDIVKPDHVSVITDNGKMTVSITKDGAAITVSLPVRNTFDTTPRPPLQQPELQQKNTTLKVVQGTRDYHSRPAIIPNPNSKLTEEQVKEIKAILADKEIMAKFRGITHAYHEIGRAYNISGCAVSHIARGISWKHVKD